MSDAREEIVLARITDTRQAPRGPDLYYKCGRCGERVSSQPSDNVGCRCRNIVIDVDTHRLAVADKDAFQVVRLSR